MELNDKTVDLELEKSYEIVLPKDFGIEIGKVHGVGSRSVQQDAFGVTTDEQTDLYQKGIMVILADGMGGMVDGEKASVEAIVSCLHFHDMNAIEEDPEDLLDKMIYTTNENVKQALGDNVGKGGTTLVVAYFLNGKLYWRTVGDSHIYLYRKGELIQLNEDHNLEKMLNELVGMGKITHEEALNNPQRKALTCYIGQDIIREIDKDGNPVDLEAGDRVLLMSDGIYNTLSNEEIIACMQYNAAKSAMIMDNMMTGKKKENQDNYTSLIIEIYRIDE